MDVKFQMPSTSAQGRAATLTAALLAWTLNEHAEDGRATVEWEFTAPARAVLQGSDYYARLNRAALLAFRSKYAITLYEMGCLLAGRRNPTWSGTVDELRERLGAPSNSMPNFSDFRRLVLTPGKAEIDQLAAFTMDWSERRGARGKLHTLRSPLLRRMMTPPTLRPMRRSAIALGVDHGVKGPADAILDTASLIAAAATRMSVSDTLRWPADDRVDEFKTPELYAIGVTLGGGHAVQRIADQYIKIRPDRRRQLVGEALKADWTQWVTGCAAKWNRA